MSDLPPLTIPDILPHRGRMVLLDRIHGVGAEHIECIVNVGPDAMFADPDGNVPAWVGLELMAQTIAGFVGYRAMVNGEPVKVGFLLGTRQYTADIDCFTNGQILCVRAQRLFMDESGFGVFECKITDSVSHRLLASSNVNVFQPEDAQTFISQDRSR
jgi:predicted hotdog family 3-hydroxylacyl-ACP dehydratase